VRKGPLKVTGQIFDLMPLSKVICVLFCCYFLIIATAAKSEAKTMPNTSKRQKHINNNQKKDCDDRRFVSSVSLFSTTKLVARGGWSSSSSPL